MSKTKASRKVRGADVETKIIRKIWDGVRRNHGVDDDVCLLAQPVGHAMIDQWTKDLVSFGAMQRNEYLVPVDYNLAHAAQLEAANFDWVTNYDGNLIRREPTEHLVKVPTGHLEQHITLFDSKGAASTEEVLAKMNRVNLRPTVSRETLAFAKAHPRPQPKRALVGLGSVWVGSFDQRSVLCLYWSSGGLRADLRSYDYPWSSACRFLAVPQ